MLQRLPFLLCKKAGNVAQWQTLFIILPCCHFPSFLYHFRLHLSYFTSVTSPEANSCFCPRAAMAGQAQLLTSHLHSFISTHTPTLNYVWLPAKVARQTYLQPLPNIWWVLALNLNGCLASQSGASITNCIIKKYAIHFRNEVMFSNISFPHDFSVLHHYFKASYAWRCNNNWKEINETQLLLQKHVTKYMHQLVGKKEYYF